MGAGVVCSFASFAASEGALDDLDAERDVRCRKSVTRNDVFGEDSKRPWPKDWGQREGTALWMARRDAFSPVRVYQLVNLLMTS